MESNKINYLDAVSTVCGFSKSDIVDGEIFIMKVISNIFRVLILGSLFFLCKRKLFSFAIGGIILSRKIWMPSKSIRNLCYLVQQLT